VKIDEVYDFVLEVVVMASVVEVEW